MMKGGSAIKESGLSCWPCVNLQLMNNKNSLLYLEALWTVVGEADDAISIFFFFFLSCNFREQVNSILVVNNGSKKIEDLLQLFLTENNNQGLVCLPLNSSHCNLDKTIAVLSW